jgi:hypothetical protein
MASPNGFKTYKQRGEWVELIFMAQAAERGFNVSKPWGDSAPYDVALETLGKFLRIQVKSTDCRGPRGYTCNFRPGPRSLPYTAEQMDFFAAYVIPEDMWYILPVEIPVGMTGNLLFNPQRKGQRYESYIEAWHLLREEKTKGKNITFDRQ